MPIHTKQVPLDQHGDAPFVPKQGISELVAVATFHCLKSHYQEAVIYALQ